MDFLSAVANDRKVAKAVLEQCGANGLNIEKVLSSKERDQFLRKFSVIVNTVSDEIAESSPTKTQNTAFIKSVVNELDIIGPKGQLKEEMFNKNTITKVVKDLDGKELKEEREQADKKAAISKKYNLGTHVDNNRNR
jgi:hypothetical protein